VENRATRPNSHWLKQLNTEQWLQFVQDCCTPGTQHQKLEKVGQQAIALVFFDRQEQTCTNEGDNNRNDDIRIHVLGLPTDLPPKSRPAGKVGRDLTQRTNAEAGRIQYES
jgi:hypothetical protein